tara:strand:- start:8957 stop:10243 length:1287 start_codon:yes stop_codon:yes gene_type:complete
MNTYSIIKQKQNGTEHNLEELRYLIQSFINKTIPDYQMSAWLMATFFKGMSQKETILYTQEIINSGKKISFNNLDSNKIVDKHSTGGVGDKVSFILGPILAACGCYIPMIAGRGLGHTGGTIDKLESIPGYQTNLKLDTFKSIVEKVGISIMAQTKEICPADKLIYALRDVTGTIESMPLICGSILSKKIAEGIKILILDVKYGNGAFMDSIEKAKQLGTLLKNIGENFDIKVYPHYTSMNEPLGNACGLWCEIQESIATLKGNGPKDLTEVVKYLAIQTLNKTNNSNSENLFNNVIKNGTALKIFYNMIEQHSGKIDTLENKEINKPKFKKHIISKHNGVLNTINTKNVGIALIELGAGRKISTDKLDNSAGIIFSKKCNHSIKKGDKIATIFCSNEKKLKKGAKILENSIFISNTKSKPLPLINKG